MAISISALTVGQSTSADPSTASINGTDSLHSAIFVWVGASYATTDFKEDDLSVSGGGGTWAKINTGRWAARRRNWVWVCQDWTGGSDTIGFTYTGTDPQQFTWIVEEATGVDENILYLNDYYLAEGIEASPKTISLTNEPLAGSVTYACVALENNETSLSATGFTAVTETALGTLGCRRMETAISDAPLSSVTWSWAGGNEGFGGVVLSLVDSGQTGDVEFSYRQGKAVLATGGAAFSATLDFTPLVDNTIVVVMEERNVAPTGSSMITTGYTFIGSDRVTDDSTWRRGMAAFYKKVGAGESKTVSGTWEGTQNATSAMLVMEFNGLGDFQNFGFSDNGETSNAQALTSSGLTTSTSAAMISVLGVKTFTTMPLGDDGVGYNSGFTESILFPKFAGDNFYNSVGISEKTAAGTYDTTMTINEETYNNLGLQSIILHFDLYEPAAEAVKLYSRRSRLFIT
jgi:hypothetical protein